MANLTRTHINDTGFSGVIYTSDFDPDYPTYLADIANRIAADQKFDKMCAQNIISRNRLKEIQRKETINNA